MTKDAEWGPWIGWNGGECPVDGDVIVECFCDEERQFFGEHFADEVDWSTGGAYRVKKEPVVEVLDGGMWPDWGVCFDAEITYKAGKITKIHWEADNANDQ